MLPSDLGYVASAFVSSLVVDDPSCGRVDGVSLTLSGMKGAGKLSWTW